MAGDVRLSSGARSGSGAPSLHIAVSAKAPRVWEDSRRSGKRPNAARLSLAWVL